MSDRPDPERLYLDADARCLCGACAPAAARGGAGDLEEVTRERAAAYAAALGQEISCDLCRRRMTR